MVDSAIPFWNVSVDAKQGRVDTTSALIFCEAQFHYRQTYYDCFDECYVPNCDRVSLEYRNCIDTGGVGCDMFYDLYTDSSLVEGICELR